MAITAYDRAALSSGQLSQLQAATDAWNKAAAVNDVEGMNSAHTLANQIRGYATDDSGNALEFPSTQQFLDQSQTLVREANAVAQANAQAQYDYNSAEAQKARDWSEYMSSTAHQREVADLVAAGLNPVLSAGGQGASSGQSAAASGSVANNVESMNSVFGQYLQSLIQSATQINAANTSARAVEAQAAMYTSMDYLIHENFPQNAWQAFGPELQSLMEAAEGYFNKNSGSWVSKAQEKGSSFIEGVKNWYKNAVDKYANDKITHYQYKPGGRGHHSNE